jgi:glycosyltransferase involved in cell wall biosynthesis
LSLRTAIIIPALNEERSIGLVVESVKGLVDRVIVVDNGSTDATVDVARNAGALVVHEPQRGYGAACLRGLAELAVEPPDVVLFLDGDASDHPEDALMVLNTVNNTEVEMCLGSRVLGDAERGSLTPVQRFGNWLSTRLIAMIWNVHYTDLGPLRAVRWDTLMRLGMQDRTWGWTVEMQIKAAKHGIRTQEIPVRYRRRIGTSKISGTIVGSLRAGTKILTTIARLALSRR